MLRVAWNEPMLHRLLQTRRFQTQMDRGSGAGLRVARMKNRLQRFRITGELNFPTRRDFAEIPQVFLQANESVGFAFNNFEAFFNEAPALNSLRSLITGVICGIRVEEIEDPIVQNTRYMDKLIDELAKGKPMEKILRKQV